MKPLTSVPITVGKVLNSRVTGSQVVPTRNLRPKVLDRFPCTPNEIRDKQQGEHDHDHEQKFGDEVE